MVPDLPLFFPCFFDYAHTHSPVGAFVVCLPVGIVLFLMYELLMRRPLTILLPAWVENRLPSAPGIPIAPRFSVHARYFASVAAAILIGAYTHQIWDAFTHDGRWGTRLVPALNTEIQLGAYRMPGYKLFQNGSTLLGLPMLFLLAAFGLYRTTPVDNRETIIGYKWKILAAAMCFCTPVLIGGFALATCDNLPTAARITITRTGVVIFAMLIAYCSAFQLFPAVEAKNNN